MKKRILSWALVLCMVLALLPGAAFAADVVASGECGAEGDNLTWTLDSDGVLTISGEGEMANYGDTPTPWGRQRDTIVAVVMETGVTSIGNSAFLWFSNLASVTIPDSVTRIGEYAFYSCDSLTSITIPDSVTSIGGNAFQGCSSLTSVTIQDGVTSIGDSAFWGCSSLTSITIPGSVTSIGECAFEDCSSLTSVTIQDGVTSIGGSAFWGCSSLDNLTLPDSIESIGTNILYCTAYDQNEANWVNHALYIGDYLIAVRYGVEQIEIGANVRCVADGAFGGRYYPNLTSISVSQSNPYFTAHDGVLYNKNMTRLIACPSKKEGTLVVPSNVTTIERYAFYDCSSLTSVTIPDSVTTIERYAFYYCSSLTSVTIPDSVTSISGGAFKFCSNLTSVTIPGSVTSIGKSAFFSCSNLTSVTIPGSVTSIGGSAFEGCSSLTNVTIPDSVTSIGGSAFEGCSSLTSVTIGNSVTSIGGSAFEGCSSLTSVTIPDSVTSIGWYAFSGCSALTSVTIGNSVTSIGGSAFQGCSSLTNVTIPDSVTSIWECAFDSCTNLTDVYYGGTEAQWNAIEIDSSNDSLRNAAIHYNSTGPEVHTHSYTDKVTAPTCTERGYTTHTCACSDSYVDSYVDALGHTWNDGVVTTAPTATTDGVKTSTCTVCGETKTEVLPATGVEPVDPTTVFTDVTHNWAYNGIAYCVNNGLMDGVGDGHFDPDGATTRAMVVTILWRQAGCPEPTKASPFTDLKQDWYKKAVAWAAETGVVNGMTPTTFAPEEPISRQDTATILYRYVKDVLGQDVSKTADLSAFPDGGKVAGYAQTAMAWANAAGLIRGVGVDGVDYLDPQGNATRAQAATILMRFCENAAS